MQMYPLISVSGQNYKIAYLSLDIIPVLQTMIHDMFYERFRERWIVFSAVIKCDSFNTEPITSNIRIMFFVYFPYRQQLIQKPYRCVRLSILRHLPCLFQIGWKLTALEELARLTKPNALGLQAYIDPYYYRLQ